MGTGQGQGGRPGGMAGAVPQGGIASLMGGMPPGMGGPMPQQGGMMGGQQAAQQAMQQFGQQQGGMTGQMPQGGPQMGFGQAMTGGMGPQQIPLPGMTQQQMQALINRDQQRANQFNQQQGAMGGPGGRPPGVPMGPPPGARVSLPAPRTQGGLASMIKPPPGQGGGMR